MPAQLAETLDLVSTQALKVNDSAKRAETRTKFLGEQRSLNSIGHPADRVHKLRRGENPWTLAKQYYPGKRMTNAFLKELMVYNKIQDPRKIPNGHELRFPTLEKLEASYQKAVVADKAKEIPSSTLRSGQNPWSMAEKHYGIKMTPQLYQQILDFNEIRDPRRVSVGTVIKWPELSLGKSTKAQPIIKDHIHVLQAGENPWTVAKNHYQIKQMTMSFLNKLLAYNKISNPRAIPNGAKIKLPPLEKLVKQIRYNRDKFFRDTLGKPYRRNSPVSTKGHTAKTYDCVTFTLDYLQEIHNRKFKGGRTNRGDKIRTDHLKKDVAYLRFDKDRRRLVTAPKSKKILQGSLSKVKVGDVVLMGHPYPFAEGNFSVWHLGVVKKLVTGKNGQIKDVIIQHANYGKEGVREESLTAYMSKRRGRASYGRALIVRP